MALRTRWGVVLVAAVASTVACMGPPLDPDPAEPGSDEARLKRLLVGRGFAAEQIAFAGPDVLVDGDIAFDREALLAELGPAGGDVEIVSQAAYWFRPGGGTGLFRDTVPRATNIRLLFEAGIDPRIRAAVRSAAQLWSAAGGGCIDIHESNSGRSLFVRVQDLWGRDPRTGETFPVAGRARLPMFQGGAWQLGNILWIHPETADIEDEDGQQWLEHVALHELGHVLGFPHPQDAAPAQHVAGTRRRGPSGYPSVMDYDGEETELTPDDVRGVQRVYSRGLGGACPADERL